jgi:hypothetical protein
VVGGEASLISPLSKSAIVNVGAEIIMRLHFIFFTPILAAVLANGGLLAENALVVLLYKS